MKKWIKEVVLPSWVVTKTKKEGVALTFDDGPHPEFTPKVLDVLKEHKAKATFFLVGDNIKKYPDLTRRIIKEGHRVGNHSMSHAEFAEIGTNVLFHEIHSCDELLRPSLDLGEKPIIRTPKGILNLKVLLFSLIHQRRIYLWNRDPEDFKAKSPEEILESFNSEPLTQGDVVLMHDKTPHTVKALNEMLIRMSKDNLQAVTL